jgi:hypothetical protein
MGSWWRRIGPGSDRRWPGAWAGGAAAMGAGAALGGLPAAMLVVLGSISALLAAFSAWWALAVRHDARTRGAVYIVRELGGSWEDDQVQFEAFLGQMTHDFGAVREVPGPTALHRWYWPLDTGAQEWDKRVDEVVTSLRIMRRGDNSAAQQSVVAWARWPVGMAMMARMLAAERGGPGLLIRQRVSDGRAPSAGRVDPRQHALAFDPTPARPHAGVDITHSGTIRMSRIIRRPGAPRGPRPTRVRILLLRLTTASWGPLAGLVGSIPRSLAPYPLAQPGTAAAEAALSFSLVVVDALGTGITGTADCVIREWQCVPPEGGHRWEDFEALAAGAIGWISAQVPRQDDELLLLGSTMPQEIGLGLGVHVRRLEREAWPDHLYPLVWDGDAGGFVIPRLDLGWESLRRRDPGRSPASARRRQG